MSDHRIRHNEDQSRFELDIDGDVAGVLDYQLNGTVATMFHTEVYPAKRGSGSGAALVHMALETARESGWSVIPTCSFVAGYIRAHREYHDLLHTTAQ